MKFRDPKTGEVVDILLAFHAGCASGQWDCGECRIGTKAFKINCCCRRFVIDHPAEAARLMGYEVVDDEPYNSAGTCGICEKFVPTGYSGCGRCAIDDDEMRSEDECNKKEDKPMEQVKPLKDWTLGEVAEMCIDRSCDDCGYHTAHGCRFHRFPKTWDLSDLSRFTPEEVKRAKSIVRVDPSVDRLHAESSFVWGLKNGGAVVRMRRELFPSMRDYETVKLSEIIGGNA